MANVKQRRGGSNRSEQRPGRSDAAWFIRAEENKEKRARNIDQGAFERGTAMGRSMARMWTATGCGSWGHLVPTLNRSGQHFRAAIGGDLGRKRSAFHEFEINSRNCNETIRLITWKWKGSHIDGSFCCKTKLEQTEINYRYEQPLSIIRTLTSQSLAYMALLLQLRITCWNS